MRNLSQTDEFEMIWQWAYAEYESERFGKLYGLPTEIKQKLASNNSNELTPGERIALRAQVLGVRGPLLKGLVGLGVRWHTATFDHSDLSDIIIMNWPPFVAIASSRKLSDFVAMLDKGVSPPNDEFLNTYRKMKARFSLTDMHGSPILVSKTTDGPYILVEGYSRLTALTSKHETGVLKEVTFPVVLGVSQNLQGWFLNGDRYSIPLF